MADPGFPHGGGTNSPGGANIQFCQKFPKKLHEIERIWAPRGGRPKFYYVDPPLQYYFCVKCIDHLCIDDCRKKTIDSV